jgi:hypothetical protein
MPEDRFRPSGIIFRKSPSGLGLIIRRISFFQLTIAIKTNEVIEFTEVNHSAEKRVTGSVSCQFSERVFQGLRNQIK